MPSYQPLFEDLKNLIECHSRRESFAAPNISPIDIKEKLEDDIQENNIITDEKSKLMFNNNEPYFIS